MTDKTIEQLLYDDLVCQFIAPRHLTVTWEKVSPKVRAAAQASAKSLFSKTPRGLLLFGNIGSGKTSVMSLIAMWYLKALLAKVDAGTKATWEQYRQDNDKVWLGRCRTLVDVDLAMVTHGDLVDRLRAHRLENEKDRATFPDYLKRRVLIVDDIGRGFDDRAGWHLALQDEYFDWRWRNNLPTYGTTNKKPNDQPPDGIRAWRDWDRIVDRLCDPQFMQSMVLAGDSCRRVGYGKEDS